MTLPPPSLGRKILFVFILTFGGTALILGGIELTLRIIGFGHSPSFARRATTPTGETIWRENRWVTAPFFSPELVRRPVPFRLPEKKAAGTYRIFVLGSSAAMGDPEPSFSIARMLEVMLRNAYPEHRFEVVNAAITAINSHVVRGIAEDCAKLEPDLFIVYEGNNEVIGPFGPVGVFAPFVRNTSIVRLAVWLKGTRTGQLLSAVAQKASGSAGTASEWGGMQMFSQQQIAANDPRLESVRDHFRANLTAIANAARRAGASTFLCTVLTNQRDFAPFLSQHRPNLTGDELSRWQAEIDAAETSARSGDAALATSHYRTALTLDDQHADTVFRLGRLELQQGRTAEAQRLLQRALDLDTLRFRTDSLLNQTIRDVASARNDGVQLVDLAQTIAKRNPHGLLGDELLYEHVHLTLRGTYDVAAEIFPQIVADLTRRGMTAGPAREPLSYSDARLRLAFTAHEQAMIAIELLNRFKSSPFTAQADHASRLALWQRRVETATTMLARPEASDALREIYQTALAASPNDWILARNAGAMFVARKAPAAALPLLEQALAVIPDDVDTLVALGWAYQALGEKMKAADVFAKARELEPRYPGLPAAAD